MNIIFSAQSSGLNMFYNLSKYLKKELNIKKNIFLVSDSLFFNKWEKENKFNFTNNDIFVKEWEVFDMNNNTYNIDILKSFEKKIGRPGLIDALLSDRRIIMGHHCTYTQDYKRRFTDDQLLTILQKSLLEIDLIFNKYKPKISICFVCVTLFDYLLFLFSKYYESEFINIRPSRIYNFVQLSNNIFDPSEEIKNIFNNPKNINKESYDFADSFLNNQLNCSGQYEGIVKPSWKPAEKLNMKRNIFKTFNQFSKNLKSYYFSESFKDNHSPNPLLIAIFKYFILPYRSKRVNRFLSNFYVKPNDLSNKEYAFLPLHTEPEVSLLVYAKPFVNQIEVVRYVASNLPIGMKLVVKEHPWMIGKRKINSYKKLLNIPNVLISSPEVTTKEWIDKSKFVSIISSSVGQEAVLMGKPVLTFGNCTINILPDYMVKNAKSLLNLGNDINALIKNYKSDKKILIRYLASIKQSTYPVNLYSSLLARKIAFQYEKSKFSEDIILLGNHIINKLNNIKRL